MLMRFILKVSIIILPLGFSYAHAKDFGLGIILFGPTGISTNYLISNDSSIDAAMAWSLNDDKQKFYLHSSYLWRKNNLIRLDRADLDVYFGGGARLISWDDPPGKENKSELRLGLRGVGGMGYIFNKPMIEVFGEGSLTMDVIPETDLDLGLGIGARYYF